MVLDLHGEAVDVGLGRSEVKGGAGGGCKLFVRRRKVTSSLQRRRLNDPRQLARMLKFGTNGRRGKDSSSKEEEAHSKNIDPCKIEGCWTSGAF